MTNQEAIKTLRELWRETNDPWYKAVYDMAISALEKQIPMKILIKCEPSGYEYASYCPNCKRMDVGGWSYCPNCGQSIVI